MDFQIRRISQWHHDVAVSIDGTRVDLGLHDEEQRKTLASTLREAADDLDPAATASHAAEVEANQKSLKDRAWTIAQADELHKTLCDALSGWRYIRETHGDLYGVGWDRVEHRLEAQIEASAERIKQAARAALKGDKP